MPENDSDSVMTLVCPACDYDLQGSVNSRQCPECGLDLHGFQFSLRGIRYSHPSVLLRAIRNAALVAAVFLMLFRHWWIAGLAFGIGILIEVCRRRGAEPVTLIGVSEAGLIVPGKAGSVRRVRWRRLERPERTPARYDRAKRLYERLGKGARPWIVRARPMVPNTIGLTFGMLARKDDAEAIFAQLLAFYEQHLGEGPEDRGE